MKIEEKEKYDNNLLQYSSIVRGDSNSIEEILRCIEIFEYFEDYEKCEDLIQILKNQKRNIEHNN